MGRVARTGKCLRFELAVLLLFFVFALSLALVSCQPPCKSVSPPEQDGDRDDDFPCDGDEEGEGSPSDGEEPDLDSDQDPDPVDGDIQPDDEPRPGERQTDSFGLMWVYLPSGTFLMGCHPNESDCMELDYAMPRHTRTVKGFWMMRTPVTQKEFGLVMRENPSYFYACGEDCPVESVLWIQANEFCELVGGRLPSEAEWEYAARGGTDTVWYCGDELECLETIAWYRDNTAVEYPGCQKSDILPYEYAPCLGTSPVGLKRANRFGLHDMLGNVWEWVADCIHYDYEDAPESAEVWRGGDCRYRARRGGSWDTGTMKYDFMTEFPSPSMRGYLTNYEYRYDIGFRCARVLETQK